MWKGKVGHLYNSQGCEEKHQISRGRAKTREKHLHGSRWRRTSHDAMSSLVVNTLSFVFNHSQYRLGAPHQRQFRESRRHPERDMGMSCDEGLVPNPSDGTWSGIDFRWGFGFQVVIWTISLDTVSLSRGFLKSILRDNELSEVHPKKHLSFN